MCGIAGFYKTSVTANQVQALIDDLKHRGPDDQGTYIDDDIGLIHTRLSIIEVSKLGAQPFKFQSLHLVFNGELYNYQNVRIELEKRGYTFDSNSDTEVLIKAFHCWREECVDKFIGMFAFAVYEEESDCLWLFRDRMGVKPLYYSLNSSGLVFASELKALSILQNDRQIDTQALFFYFRFGFVPSHLSIFKSINKLPAGHFLKIINSSVEIRQYWLPTGEIDNSKSENEWLDELEEVMVSSFCYRMVADVPVGIFLSGGIDSSLLAAMLKKHFGPIHSFTIGFPDADFDESTSARNVANYLRINHTEKQLKLPDAKKILNQFYSIYDEPFADTSGIPTSFVAELAKERGMKVVLSADGGDELFGGYPHYGSATKLFNRMELIPRTIREIIPSFSKVLVGKSLRDAFVAFNFEHKIFAIEELLNTKNPNQFFEAYIANESLDEISNLTGLNYGYLSNSKGNGTTIEQMMTWDIRHYLIDNLLVKVDRATMHHGIECREPFLDHRLIELSQTMPQALKIQNGQNKYIVRKLLSRYLPIEMFSRKKQGFSIPIFSWFSKELDDLFSIYFNEEQVKEIPFLQYKEVQREYKKYLYYKSRNKEYNIEKMWRILSYILWWKKHGGHEI